MADFDDYVRYEEDGTETEPTVYTDHDGRAGKSLLTKENSLVRYLSLRSDRI